MKLVHEKSVLVHLYIPVLICSSVWPMVPAAEAVPRAFEEEEIEVPVNKTTSGVITEDEIWENEMLLTGDIVIPPSITLKIMPGTHVLFTAQSDDQAGGGDDRIQEFPEDPCAIPSKMISITVLGDLVARGNPDHQIYFLSDSPDPNVIDWQSIMIESDSFLVMEYVHLEYCYWGIQINDPNARGVISHSIFNHIATCGICCAHHMIHGPLFISDNHFINCGHEGVDTYPENNVIIQNNIFAENGNGVAANGSSVLIRSNLFHSNRSAIAVFNNAYPTIMSNDIVENVSTGILIQDSSIATMNKNNIFGNPVSIEIDSKPSQTIDAKNNWWGTVNTVSIEDSIAIYDPSVVIDYTPFALEPFNHPPGYPYMPSPENHASGIGTDVMLTWDCEDIEQDVIQYDVLFDSANPPVMQVASGLSKRVLEIGDLESKTDYYWRVVAHDGENTTMGEVWHLRTAVSYDSPDLDDSTMGDFSLLALDWHSKGTDLRGNLNQDHRVDGEDLRILGVYWLSHCDEY